MGEDIIRFRISLLKELILKLEPDGITQRMLEANSWGKSTKLTNEFLWTWNKERIRGSNGDEIIQLVLNILWT